MGAPMPPLPLPPETQEMPQEMAMGVDQMLPEAPLEGLEALTADLPPAFSKTSVPSADVPPDNLYSDVGAPQPQDMDEVAEKAMTALYGSDFPLLNPDAKDDDWIDWAKSMWERHASGPQTRLHLNERNRAFRKGSQWISSVGLGPWRDPPKPRDSARVVHNVIGPALDQRTQLVIEQRPGFRTRPATHDPDDQKRAEAQQIALEYQYDQQDMAKVLAEHSYWAGTDGVTFWEMCWDPERGPWHELGNTPQQQSAVGGPKKFPLGDVYTKVRRAEQVRVSAEASATQKPWYWVIRETMVAAHAVRMYGKDVVDSLSNRPEGTNPGLGTMPKSRLGFLLPEEEDLLKDQETTDRITIYCERSEYMSNGLTLIVVGDKLVFQGPLVCGVIPIVRATDGSTDPSFYPQPNMDLWIDSQMRINAVLSKWVENVRLNAGARLLAKEHAISGETLIGGTMSVIGVKGMGSLSEIVRPLEGFSLNADAKELLNLEVKAFEDLSGWNSASRGQFSADQSGRAVLAIREQMERIFTPTVMAVADAMTEWSKITLHWLKWGYELPRLIGVEGRSRPDLARELSSDDFDGVTDVWIDPETMMPMPRSLKLFLLKDLFQQGLMGQQEYRRRLPFAWTQSIGTPDEDHEARARRCAEALRQTANPMAMEILWQDNEAIHQDVLERELILPDDTPPPVRVAAQQRWIALANQAMMKMGGQPPQAQPQAQGKGTKMSPGEQPFAGTQPGIAAAPTLQMGGQGDAQAAAKEFDQRSPV